MRAMGLALTSGIAICVISVEALNHFCLNRIRCITSVARLEAARVDRGALRCRVTRNYPSVAAAMHPAVIAAPRNVI